MVATMDEDDRVHSWTVWSGHVYAYLNCTRYDFEFAEGFMKDYSEMARDAVVLGANDTSDTGIAKYYGRTDLAEATDTYEETQREDGTFVGEMALCVINSRHGIMARDPFHNEAGSIDDNYLNSGNIQELKSTTDVNKKNGETQ